jgi:hypothetical protein
MVPKIDFYSKSPTDPPEKAYFQNLKDLQQLQIEANLLK